jgi:UDP-3-O-[3-hydroxymyristoyl] glucosamine N-acyltransferase
MKDAPPPAHHDALTLAHRVVDAPQLLDALTSIPELDDLIHQTMGLPEAIAHVSRIRSALAPDERRQAKAILEMWRHPTHLDPPAPGDLEGLANFVSTRWDMRLGAERDAIPTAPDFLPPSWADASLRMARALDWLDPTSAVGHFDCVIVLGGMVRANLVRTAYAATLLREKAISTPLVVGLTAERMLSPGECSIADQLGVAGLHERRSMADGLLHAFAQELGPDARGKFDRVARPDEPVTQRASLRWDEDEVVLMILTAPRNIDGTRPSAAQCLEWLISNVQLPELNRVLIVTSPVYRVQNHIDALEALAWARLEAEVVTVGSDGTAPLGREDLRQVYQPQHYLQECKALVDALQRLNAIGQGALNVKGSQARLTQQARRRGNARIGGAAVAGGSARIQGDAYVGGRAWISDNAVVTGMAKVVGYAEVEANARVSGNAIVEGNARIAGDARVYENARVSGRAWVGARAVVRGDARVGGSVEVKDDAIVEGHARVFGRVFVESRVRIGGHVQISGREDGGIEWNRPREDAHLILIGADDEGGGFLVIDDQAEISGDVVVRGAGKIYGRAKIRGLANIGSGADIFEAHHVQAMTTASGTPITVYRSVPEGAEEPFVVMYGAIPIRIENSVLSPAEKRLLCSLGEIVQRD